jgi:hypothetical protein
MTTLRCGLAGIMLIAIIAGTLTAFQAGLFFF